MQDRWIINIDIEGFSVLWEKEEKVLLSLGKLMHAISQIGKRCFPESPERLFAHQIVDGFLIASNYHEDNLERAVTIAVALMQHVAASGYLTKTAITEGDLSDIQSCYPRDKMDIREHRTVSLGMGLMTLFPVMGTAFTRIKKVVENSPSGPLLTIEKSKAKRIASYIPTCPIEGKDIVSIDWVHMKAKWLSEIQKCAQLSAPSPSELETMLADYCSQHELPIAWTSNIGLYLGVSGIAPSGTAHHR